MSNVTDACWYVVQTQVNSEARAEQNLLRQGYEVYLPRYLKRRRHARKVDLMAKPLFPRYMLSTEDMGKAMINVAKRGAPKPILEGANKADSDAAKKKLEDAGAKVEVK